MTNADASTGEPDADSATASEESATHVLKHRTPGVGRSSGPKPVVHFTPAERAARGRAARGELPRSAHAVWEPAPGRVDPVELLEQQAQTRLPELGPIRYGRMLCLPVRLLTGAVPL